MTEATCDDKCQYEKFLERQRKNEKLLRELKRTRFIVKYNKYMLKLMYKNDRTFFENLILKYSISTNKMEKILKK